jgi:[acyl-carrier-protein] S-malonyltransferase
MNGNAFLFPGQGSQYAGMGKALAQEYPTARRVFEEADDALGCALSKIVFEGPEETLKQTENTQPALLTVSVAAHRVLAERGYTADVVAGHSLGEYSALVCGGALKFADAVRLVRKRGQYMQTAIPSGVGAMAAILKLPEGKLDGVLKEAAQGEVVTAANLNSPDQVVIAGHLRAVERAMELARAAGAKRAIALPVSAPFHCPLMLPAQERMREHLAGVTVHDLAVPLIDNWQAREITRASEVRESLLNQIPNPVRWTDTIRKIARMGVTKVIEVGAGSVLVGLTRQIEPSLKAAKFGEPADLEKAENLIAASHEKTVGVR